MREDPSVTIRNIKESDIVNVWNMAMKTPEIHTQKGEPDYYSKKQLEGFIKNPDAIFLGAFIDKKLVGFRLATFDKYAKEAYLINLIVDKKYEHRGIGQLLYRKTFEVLKKNKCIWSWVLVHERNKRMQDFLEKQDFEKGPKFIYFRKRLLKKEK